MVFEELTKQLEKKHPVNNIICQFALSARQMNFEPKYLLMENVSTRFKRKTVKREKPSRHVIESILNYSRSLAVMTNQYGNPFVVINN